MDQLFSGLKHFFFKAQKIQIDNVVFKLHYRVTMIILIAFSIMVTGRQYIGDPIDCISKDDIPNDLLDTFCWIHTTFSVESGWFKEVGKEVPYPGVDKYLPGEKKVYHAYYQWVCFVLFLQAILFYIPRYFWRNMEGHRLQNLLLGMQSPVIDKEKKKKNTDLLTLYLFENKRQHLFYVFCFVLAETMNLINVLGQMFFINTFLDGEFSKYGPKVAAFTEWDWRARYDPMLKVFPRMTKCTFHKFGSSGDVQKHDALCLLPINILNEKIYVFLWFWFVILTIISGIMLIYRFCALYVDHVAIMSFKNQNKMLKHGDAVKLCKFINDPGDRFLLMLLAKNMDVINFRDLVKSLIEKHEDYKEHYGLEDQEKRPYCNCVLL